MAAKQVLKDGHGLDDDLFAVLEGRDESAGVDGHELRIAGRALEQVDLPQAIGKAHFLEQPDDPKAPALAPDGDHAAPPGAGHEKGQPPKPALPLFDPLRGQLLSAGGRREV